MSDLDEYWFDPQVVDDPSFLPLPRADRRLLLDPAAWRAAERDCAVELAQAAMAIGRLDGLLAGLDETLRRGLITRLALMEVEAMLWAAGTPIGQDVLIRDLADAPASVDLEALSLARWAIGRLQGRGRVDDLRDFLTLHRAAQGPGRGDSDLLRKTGDDFDHEAEGFAMGLAALDGCHATTCAAYGQRLWRLTDLSPDWHQLEGMCWAARAMADSAGPLAMVPMGQAGRRVWNTGGDPVGFLADWCAAVVAGCEAGFHLIRRLTAWVARAEPATDRMKGRAAARAVAVLTAHPVVSTLLIEREAAVSRDTAERLLLRLQELGLVREITGGRRYRFWCAAV
ncbi:helix-turn-helix domain-containing protein [Paracoccus aurantiacus]|uniref:helix-turn-helix domain-containing protein n=1 Tax=Paracoccus aurantiacus TaxID=2599412 RepID=UPI00364200FD